MEIAAAEAALEEARTREADATEASSAAEALAEQTRAALDALRELQEQDNELGTRLAASRDRPPRLRAGAAEAELGRLDQRAAERAMLVRRRRKSQRWGSRSRYSTSSASARSGCDHSGHRTRRNVSGSGPLRRVGRLVSECPVDGIAFDGGTGARPTTRPETGIERLLRAAASLDARGVAIGSTHCGPLICGQRRDGKAGHLRAVSAACYEDLSASKESARRFR